MASRKSIRLLPWIIAVATVSACFENIEDESPSAEEDEACDFSYENAIFDDAGVDVHYLYISPSSSTQWGADLLGASILPYGATVIVEDVPVGSWDTRVIDEDGFTYSVYGIDCNGDDLYWRITAAHVD